jgi:hypothetical protein
MGLCGAGLLSSRRNHINWLPHRAPDRFSQHGFDTGRADMRKAIATKDAA